MSQAAAAVWVAVAESGEVGRHLLACTAASRRLVAFRRQDGHPVVLDDECWHRLLPLSNGRLDGDELTCAYHGLVFAADGRCARTRAGAPPDGACVRSYPTAEADGRVWVAVDSDHRRNPEPAPDRT